MSDHDPHAFMDRPAWMADANCRGLDVNVFFPNRGESLEQIRKICRACDVQAECLAYALNNGEVHGTWGGLSERERRQLRRNDRPAGARGPLPGTCQPIQHGTNGGYITHRRRGELACEDCRSAHALYKAERRELA